MDCNNWHIELINIPKNHTSDPVDEKDVKIEFINSTVQVNVKGAELDQDKRFDKVSDPLVNLR